MFCSLPSGPSAEERNEHPRGGNHGTTIQNIHPSRPQILRALRRPLAPPQRNRYPLLRRLPSGARRNALLVVERNNHGHGVLAHLGSQSYPNIYSDGKQQGWLTTAASRPTMIENFAAVLSANPELFRSIALLNECRTFVRHKDGTSGAAQGAHDDRVMAMAIALASRRQLAGKIPPPIQILTITGFL